MSYDCSDFQQDVFNAMQRAGLVPADADPESPSEAADFALAAIVAMKRTSKAGIRRTKTRSMRPALHAHTGLDYLRMALGRFKTAGACYTVARVRSAISSAKGAVRAAQYRQSRGQS